MDRDKYAVFFRFEAVDSSLRNGQWSKKECFDALLRDNKWMRVLGVQCQTKEWYDHNVKVSIGSYTMFVN
jgi:hypothetical protein